MWNRRENRREDRRAEILLRTAVVSLVAAMVTLCKAIIDWLRG
jgi:hypothetical protein